MRKEQQLVWCQDRWLLCEDQKRDDATMRCDNASSRAHEGSSHTNKDGAHAYNSDHTSFKCVETYTSGGEKKSQLGLFFFFKSEHFLANSFVFRCGRGDVINPFCLSFWGPPALLQECKNSLKKSSNSKPSKSFPHYTLRVERSSLKMHYYTRVLG